MNAPIHLLVNPAAANGRAARHAQRAYAALRTIGPVEVLTSQCAGDETRIAIDAARAGARALVVLGGDGAVSHAARGLITERSTVPLAIMAAGTGNDFAKSAGLPSHDAAAMATVLSANRSRPIDAGEIDGVPFVNSAGFGFDVDVLSRVRTAPSRALLRGTALYVTTALRRLFSYREFAVHVMPHSPTDAPARDSTGTEYPNDGGPPHHDPALLVVFANGQWFGGTFRIAPDAQLTDGMLRCVHVGAAPASGRLRLFASAVSGRHVHLPMVTLSRANQFTVHFPHAPQFQADGELHQARGKVVSVQTLPSALRIVTR